MNLNGARRGNRTPNLRITSALRYQLRHASIYSTIVVLTSHRLLNPVKGKFFGTLAILFMSMRQRYL